MWSLRTGRSQLVGSSGGYLYTDVHAGRDAESVETGGGEGEEDLHISTRVQVQRNMSQHHPVRNSEQVLSLAHNQLENSASKGANETFCMLSQSYSYAYSGPIAAMAVPRASSS